MSPYDRARLRGRVACQERFDIAEARGMSHMIPCEIACRGLDEEEAGFVTGWNEVVRENE